MVSTFTREIVINADLIVLSPTLFKYINSSNYFESIDDFTTDINSCNDYVIQLVYDSLVKFVLVDLCTFIIAGDDVLNWNHRRIILDKFYRQIFYPVTINDYQALEQTASKDSINVCYNISVCGTKMLVPGEVNMIKTAIDKFTSLMYTIDLKTKYATFTYDYRFEDGLNRASDQNSGVIMPKVDGSKFAGEITQSAETGHLNIDNNMTSRLSEIIIPFLLVPELDNFVGIYHRAPRILIYGDDNRKAFDRWLGTLKHHLNFKHIPISISHIFSCYCGDSERNLTFAFDLAKSQTRLPTILVLYGIHLICTDSSDKSDMSDRLLTTLLLQLDRLNQPLQSGYTHAQINSTDVQCSDECPIFKWITQCDKSKLSIDIDLNKANKASQIAVVAFTDLPIDDLCQAVTRKGRFDFLLDNLIK